MKVFWNPIQLAHRPEFFLQRGRLRQNFEVPARAEALLAACQAMGLEIVAAQAVAADALLAVHDAGYLRFLEHGHAAWAALEDAGPEIVSSIHLSPEMACQGGGPPVSIAGQAGFYMADSACPIGADTWPAVIAAGAGALAAAEEAAGGRSAYVLARPPGHHAYAARAGGHCYANNAALAAAHLRRRGAARVAVLDIDSHHGNGTQGIFWDRDDVFFASIHGDPNHYYPWFTGHADERGGPSGLGANLNFPLPIGSGDEVWLAAIGHAIAAIQTFGAEALVVSLGFDASKDEPLNALAVTETGFARAGAAIAALQRPTVLVQEGGYNVGEIGRLLTRFLDGFRGGFGG